MNPTVITLPVELLARVGVLRNLTEHGKLALMDNYYDLVQNQGERLASGEQPTRLPLIWIALAEAVGLTVSDDGRIVDGPHGDVAGL